MTKSRKSPYIWFILLLLGAFILFSIWAARQAAKNGSRIADPAYYSKGLKYTNTQLEKQAAASQGWSLTTKIEQKTLRFALVDHLNQPITEAYGEMTLYLSERKELLHLNPQETAPGHYQVNLPQDLHGSLQARIEFVREGARISRQLLVSL